MSKLSKDSSTYNNLLKRRSTYLFEKNDLLFVWANLKDLSKMQNFDRAKHDEAYKHYAENLNITKSTILQSSLKNRWYTTFSFTSFPKRALNRFFLNAVLPLKGCGVFLLGLNLNNKTNIILENKVSKSFQKVKYVIKCALLLESLLTNYKLQNNKSGYTNIYTKKSPKTKDLLNILRVNFPIDLNQLLGAFVKEGNTNIWIQSDEIKQSLYLIRKTNLRSFPVTITMVEALAKTSFCNIQSNIQKVSTSLLQNNQKQFKSFLFLIKKLESNLI